MKQYLKFGRSGDGYFDKKLKELSALGDRKQEEVFKKTAVNQVSRPLIL